MSERLEALLAAADFLRDSLEELEGALGLPELRDLDQLLSECLATVRRSWRGLQHLE